MAIVFERANGLRALQSELRDLLKRQNRSLESEQRVERSLEPERHTNFESHRFPIHPIFGPENEDIGAENIYFWNIY